MNKTVPVETLCRICFIFSLRKGVVSQGVFGIEDLWVRLSSFRVNFYKVYRIIY